MVMKNINKILIFFTRKKQKKGCIKKINYHIYPNLKGGGNYCRKNPNFFLSRLGLGEGGLQGWDNIPNNGGFFLWHPLTVEVFFFKNKRNHIEKNPNLRIKYWGIKIRCVEKTALTTRFH